MPPFRWPPATGSADKEVVHIEARSISQGAPATAGTAAFLKAFFYSLK